MKNVKIFKISTARTPLLQGDSGGPMTVQTSGGRWQLAGIISWGIGCAKRNQPGVMTNMAHFRHWVNSVILY